MTELLKGCGVSAIGSPPSAATGKRCATAPISVTLRSIIPLLAELTGISVVADFRSRDVAAGGQGAPLVPAFHRAAFGGSRAHRVIVNIGGVANLTDLPSCGRVTGFDTGPGNMLMDAWIGLHRGQTHDHDGTWAGQGGVLPALLESLLGHDYFRRPFPKSTGRETFSLAWVQSLLSGNENPADVQATLLALTADSAPRRSGVTAVARRSLSLWRRRP